MSKKQTPPNDAHRVLATLLAQGRVSAGRVSRPAPQSANRLEARYVYVKEVGITYLW